MNVTTVVAAIKAIPGFIARVKDEPVMIAAAAIVLLQAWQEASAQSLGGEDLFIYIGQAGIAFLARSLVYPATKVDAATAALKPVEEKLAEPFLGDPE